MEVSGQLSAVAGFSPVKEPRYSEETGWPEARVGVTAGRKIATLSEFELRLLNT
jgi:hypothetical protein